MALNRSLRWALAATLVVCAGTAWFGPASETETVSAVAATRKTTRAAAAASTPWPSGPRQIAATDWATLEPRAAAMWGVAPPPPVVAPPLPAPPPATASAPAEPPPPPPAPPFPYKLIGQIEAEGRVSSLLVTPLQTISVAPGDVVDRNWRVESAKGGELTVLWVPGGQRQKLSYQPS